MTIRIRRRNTGNAGAPAALANAELAFNEVDDILYYGKGTGGPGGTASTMLQIAGPGAFVARTGDQTIAGVKTFSSSPVVPTPAFGDNSTLVATTAFVAAAVTAASVPDGNKGDITTVGATWTVNNNAITNAKLATAPALTLKGNNTGTVGSVLDLTAAQVRSLLTINNVDNTSDATKFTNTPLTGVPTAPTAAVNTSTTQLATTAFVLGQASAATPLVNGTAAVGTSTRFSREDHVHPIDTTRAPLANPTFTGVPAAPTPAVDTNTTQLATTAFVLAQAAAATPLVNGTAAVGTSTRFARADHVHPTDTTRAPLASPNFTGLVVAPAGSASQAGGLRLTAGTIKTTPVVGDSGGIEYDGTRVHFIDNTGARRSLAHTTDTYTGTISSSQVTTALGFTPYNASNPAGYITSTALTPYAPLLSPAFTGIPTAPTAAGGNSSTQIATTQFVASAIANLLGTAPGALDQLGELAAALGNDPNFSTTIINALAGKADLTLSNLSNAATARNNLGLGSMALQAANAVAITGGTIAGTTIDGGTF